MADSVIRVVLIDDQEMVREGIVVMLNQNPSIEIAAAAPNIDLVLEVLGDRNPDVLLIDADLAGLDAFASISRMRSRFPQIRVIMLITVLRDGIIRHALSYPVDGIVSKHDSFRSIPAAIEAAVTGKRLYSPRICNRLSAQTCGKSSSRVPLSAKITAREFSVISALARGCTSREAARSLGVTTNTVDNHKSRIMKKLDLHSNVELARYAIREGIVTV